MMRALLLCLAVLGACKERAPAPAPVHDASRARRVLEPPPGEVRSVPPHVIHAKGIGPYVFGTSLKKVLGYQPRGPRMVLLQIDGVVDYSLVRAESETVIVGGDQPTGVMFVAVLDKEIARTESGVGVGTSAAELRAALEPALESLTVARDPRMMAFERLPSARFVLDGPRGSERVIAVVVVRRDDDGVFAGGGKSAAAPPGGAACATLEAPSDEIALAARLSGGKKAVSVVHGCFSGTGSPEIAVASEDRVVIVGGEPGKLRKLAVYAASGVVYAAALDVDEDRRPELALVTETVNERERLVRLELLRFDAGRLTRMLVHDLYRVSAASAAWMGTTLGEIRLLVELRVVDDLLTSSGIYVQRDEDEPVVVAPLLPSTVPLKRRRGASPAPAPALPSAASADEIVHDARPANETAPDARPASGARQARPGVQP